MSKLHKVLQGEHLSGIAERHGFLNWKTVWEHSGNAALRAKRSNPHILFPGDEIFIPDKVTKDAPAQTTTLNVFAVTGGQLFLRLKVLDADFTPLKSSPYKAGLQSKEGERTGQTDGNGLLKELINRPVDGVVNAEVKVTFTPKTGAAKVFKYDLKIGELNPIDKFTGQQARLNNLGYFAGFDPADTEQLRWAAEEFQEDQVFKGQKAVEKILTILPEAVDVPKTGVVNDSTFLTTLEKVHGS